MQNAYGFLVFLLISATFYAPGAGAAGGGLGGAPTAQLPSHPSLPHFEQATIVKRGYGIKYSDKAVYIYTNIMKIYFNLF